MSNPVIADLDRQAAKYTPAGYPTMPGYTPGTGAAPSDSRSPAREWDSATQQQWEQRFQAPAATPAQRGRVTLDDVARKTGLLFAVLVVAAAAGWGLTLFNPGLAGMLTMGGVLVALVLVIVISFKKTISPALILAYALAEGFALGAISAFAEFRFPGIVVQALLGTVCVFAVTLGLFKAGKVRNSPKLMKIVMAGLIGVILYSLVSFGLVAFGLVGSPLGLDGVRIMGIPLGLVVGLLAVLLGAASLVIDFDIAVRCVNAGMPKVVAWRLAFGLIVTLVWLYLEILRVLAILRSE